MSVRAKHGFLAGFMPHSYMEEEGLVQNEAQSILL